MQEISPRTDIMVISTAFAFLICVLEESFVSSHDLAFVAQVDWEEEHRGTLCL